MGRQPSDQSAPHAPQRAVRFCFAGTLALLPFLGACLVLSPPPMHPYYAEQLADPSIHKEPTPRAPWVEPPKPLITVPGPDGKTYILFLGAYEGESLRLLPNWLVPDVTP